MSYEIKLAVIAVAAMVYVIASFGMCVVIGSVFRRGGQYNGE